MKHLKSFKIFENKSSCANQRCYNVFNKVFEFRDFINLVRLVDDFEFDEKDLKEWMLKYDFDENAAVTWVANDPLDIKGAEYLQDELQHPDIVYHIRKMPHKSFYQTSIDKDGFIIPESEIIAGIYLYVFEKNKKVGTNKARQIRGFNYQSEIMRLNYFSSAPYTSAWDAVGKISGKLFRNRLNKGKKIFFNSNILNEKEIFDKNSILKDFYKYLNWSIKVAKKGRPIDLGSLKRILKVKKDFIFNVAFYDENIKEEYFVLIKKDNWEKYLPNVDIDQMEFEMKSNFKLSKEDIKDPNKTKYKEDREKWLEFIEKWKRFDNIIKSRFKRDSKGQLRIQCSLSNKDFYDVILKENDFILIK